MIVKMEKLKRKNGITLIALIITIVVLLILVGVSLNAVIGDNGIINQTQEAAIKAEMTQFLEDAEMAYVDVYEEKTTDEGEEIITSTDVADRLIDAYGYEGRIREVFDEENTEDFIASMTDVVVKTGENKTVTIIPTGGAVKNYVEIKRNSIYI